MRRLIDSMIVLMLLSIAVGVVLYQKSANHEAHNLKVVHEGLSEFKEQVTLHGAIGLGEDQEAGLYPALIEPRWFAGDVPENPMVSADHPWLDIAPEEDYNDQPPDPITTADQQAAFWYNPNNGVVRARVSQQVSERLTLDLYNEINGTALSSLPYDRDPERAPLAFNPTPTTTGQLASPDGRTVGGVQADDPAAQETEQVSKPRPWWLPKLTSEKKPDPDDDPDAPKRPSLLSP